MYDEPDVRYGVKRESQAKNVLLCKTELGKVRIERRDWCLISPVTRRPRPSRRPTGGAQSLPSVFRVLTRLPLPAALAPRLLPPPIAQVKPRVFAAPPADDFVFGLKRVRDDENAKEVTMRWSEHKPPPESLPGPDFRAMNKLAAVNDVLDARETAAFRKEHHITLRAGPGGAGAAPGGSHLFVAPALPSDFNPEHAYGKSSLVPSAEERKFGSNVPMKAVINGAFANEWAKANEKRAKELTAMARKPRPKPRTTRAAEARAAAAAAKTAPAPKPAPFKMKLFENVQSKCFRNSE
jgi:hypothetical protein